MKKTLVLTIALVLAVGMPLLATEVTFGGDLTWGFLYNPESEEYSDAQTATLDVKLAIDDFNSGRISIEQDDLSIMLEEAWLKHDLGANFGLADMGFGLELTVGFFEATGEEFGEVSGHGAENVFEASTDDMWGLQADIILMDLVTLRAAGAPNLSNWILGAFAAFGPLNAEVFFAQADADDWKGDVVFDASYQMAPMADATLELGAGLGYNLTDEAIRYGVGVNFEYGMFEFGAGFAGNEENAADDLDLSLTLSLLENFAIDTGLALDLGDGEDTLNNLDVSAKLNVGIATARLGYIFTELESGIRDYKCSPTNLAHGGLYLCFDVNY